MTPKQCDSSVMCTVNGQVGYCDFNCDSLTAYWLFDLLTWLIFELIDQQKMLETHIKNFNSL